MKRIKNIRTKLRKNIIIGIFNFSSLPIFENPPEVAQFSGVIECATNNAGSEFSFSEALAIFQNLRRKNDCFLPKFRVSEMKVRFGKKLFFLDLYRDSDGIFGVTSKKAGHMKPSHFINRVERQ